ncbi:hypothetical protein GY45DRAFT_1367554 [Cubamyces sp. BRFM 1775]|nr:hypothetical protein GY45DRAFT_1367554 [Cubamyces sp. BRFM 1775]
MAFAQYYYDPALEFERALDDDSREAGAMLTTAALADNGPAAAAKAKSTEMITRSSSMGVEPQPTQGCGGRWFGDGLLKRRASTGSINGGSHPGVPK